MEFEKQIFFLKNDSIKIDIRLGFEDEVLKLNGYDIGKIVEEAWGDSDYEYSITIEGDELIKLYRINNVEEGQKQNIINILSEKINGNKSYSDFGKYLTENKIIFKSFTWT